jgi:hypothetical protein
MLTIEHCDTIHLHLSEQNGSIFGQTLEAAFGEAPIARVAPALGDVWAGEGGRYVGTMPARAGRAGYHLILADGQRELVAFGPYEHDVQAARDHNDGLANTKALLASGEQHPAALWASEVTATREPYQRSGHDDFYLPAHNELMLMWICVPHLFKKEGWYWSSTQYSPFYAWAQVFEYGYSYVDFKSNEFRAVAVRRLEI